MAIILPATVHNPSPGAKIPSAWGDAVDDAIAALVSRGSVASATASGSLALALATTDIPGASIPIVMTDAGSVLIVATFDFSVTAATAGTQVGVITVNGADTQVATYDVIAGTGRASVSGLLVSPLAAGASTIKLRAFKNTAGGTSSVSTLATRLVVTRVT